MVEELNGVEERAAANCHHEIDRIKVFGTAKAARQVRLGVNGGVELVTDGAKKP